MSSSFGKNIKITVFGQSHSRAIGVVLDGLPAGEAINLDDVYRFMKRRAPGQNAFSTARNEADMPQILSGLVDGITCGAPLCAMIENSDTRSKDYDSLKTVPRPSHADFAAMMKHGGFNDVRGGGHFSGRLTAPLCFAGGVCMQILERKGIHVGAHVFSIAGTCDDKIDMVNGDLARIKSAAQKSIPAISDNAAELMAQAILEAKGNNDSVGGVIECVAVGLPIGLGEPMFDGLENRIAAAMFGIPAVRGIEFGLGFDAAKLRGSTHNDPFEIDQNGVVKTTTNNHGGILGGISSGMPMVLRVAFKPTPSIAAGQQSVDIKSGKHVPLNITGRHDPCIVPRAVPCVEAVLAAVLLDFMIEM